jgi:hypothetical protein
LVGFDEDDGWIVMILMFVTHVRGDAIFLCIPASVFVPFFGFGLEHTLWISLLVVFSLFPLWHSICWSVFRFSV